MNEKISRCISSNLMPISLLAFFLLISASDRFGSLYGEDGPVEIIQVLILFTGLFVTIRFKRLMTKYSNNLVYYLRVSLFVFLLYEELSFLTEGRLWFLNSINQQSQLNLHNLNPMYYYVFRDINVPILNYSFSLHVQALIFALAILFIGFGSYIFPFRSLRIFFLEKKYSFYCLVFPMSFLSRHILSIVGIETTSTLIHAEFNELFFYTILTLDALFKIRLIHQSNRYLK